MYGPTGNPRATPRSTGCLAVEPSQGVLPEGVDRMRATKQRRIGQLGTVSRLLVGAAMVLLAFLHGNPWGLRWYDLVLGLVVLPLVILVFVLVAPRFTARPLHFTGRAGTAINCAVIVVLLFNPFTAGAAQLFYGATLLIAAWRGQPDCEITVISNWLLRGEDQIGCPIFTPIDRFENSHKGPARAP